MMPTGWPVCAWVTMRAVAFARYVVVPKGVPCFASSSLGEIARQISEHEYPHDDQPPSVPAADPR
jgi:hypothetical protein